jgi:hypothetical protein
MVSRQRVLLTTLPDGAPGFMTIAGFHASNYMEIKKITAVQNVLQ